LKELQFSESELEEFGVFLLHQYISREVEAGYKQMPIREIVRLALVDWVDKKGKWDGLPIAALPLLIGSSMLISADLLTKSDLCPG
jgi:hypothetical protein